MSRPSVAAATERWYAQLGRLTDGDDSTGWLLLRLLEAVGRRVQAVDDLVRDTDAGPGWSPIVDVDRAPGAWLDWLGQLVGVAPAPALDADTRRRRIKAVDGFHRGTPQSMRQAAYRHLTGTRAVLFRERAGGDPYRVVVITYASQTPDPAAVLVELTAAKPAGLVMDYAVFGGQDYVLLALGHRTYADAMAAYATYAAMRDDTPAGP